MHTITFYDIAVTRHYFGVIFNNLFHRHETIKVKFNKEHPREGGGYINGPGHMTKMAAMAIHDKNSLKLFLFRTRRYMVMRLCMKHQGKLLYIVYVNH